MAAVAEFRIVACFGFLRFAYDLVGAYIGKRRRHTQFGRRSTDPSRDDKHHMLVKIPVMPVDLSDKLCDKILFLVGHAVVFNSINIYDDIKGCRPAHAHG